MLVVMFKIVYKQNIKKLLKIPFENSHISMMVHRVGKTLLLDEFDIHKHLLRKEQVNNLSLVLQVRKLIRTGLERIINKGAQSVILRLYFNGLCLNEHLSQF